MKNQFLSIIAMMIISFSLPAQNQQTNNLIIKGDWVADTTPTHVKVYDQSFWASDNTFAEAVSILPMSEREIVIKGTSDAYYENGTRYYAHATKALAKEYGFVKNYRNIFFNEYTQQLIVWGLVTPKKQFELDGKWQARKEELFMDYPELKDNFEIWSNGITIHNTAFQIIPKNDWVCELSKKFSVFKENDFEIKAQAFTYGLSDFLKVKSPKEVFLRDGEVSFSKSQFGETGEYRFNLDFRRGNNGYLYVVRNAIAFNPYSGYLTTSGGVTWKGKPTSNPYIQEQVVNHYQKRMDDARKLGLKVRCTKYPGNEVLDADKNVDALYKELRKNFGVVFYL